MENAVYWKGKQIGLEVAGRVTWSASAPLEAIAVLEGRAPDSSSRTGTSCAEDSASNFAVCADIPAR